MAIALMGQQMSELRDDLAIAQAATLPPQDSRLTLPSERRPPTRSRYLATMLGEVLSLAEGYPNVAIRRLALECCRAEPPGQ